MPDFEEMLVKIRGDVSDLIKAYATGEAASKAFKESVGKDSKDTSGSFKSVGKDADEMSKTIARAMKDGQTTVQSFKSRSAELRGEMTRLRQEFLKTGDPVVFKGFKTAETELRHLSSAAKDLGIELDQVAKVAGRSFGQKMVTSIQDSFFSKFSGIGSLFTNPASIAALAVVGTVLSSVVAAGISAGVGLGFVGIGAYVQRNQPAIVSAFAGLKTSISNVLKDSTSSLVGPIVDALNALSSFAVREGPTLKAIFAPLGSVVQTIGRDLQGLVTAIAPSLAKIATTFAETFSNPNVQGSLRGLAAEFTTLFNTIGNHPREVEEGFVAIGFAAKFAVGMLNLLIHADSILNDGLTGIGNLIIGHWRTAWKDFTGQVKEGSFGIGQFGSVVNGVAVPVAGASNVVQNLGTKVKDLADAINNKLLTAFDNAIDKSLGFSNANLAVVQGLADLTQSLKTNGKSFELNTQAGRNNQQALNGEIANLKQSYDWNIAHGKSIAASSLAYQLQLDAIKKTLAAEGLNSKQIAKLTRQYELLPAQKTTLVKALGTDTAKLGVLGVMGAINHLHGKTVGINVKVFGEAAALAAVAAIRGALGKANSGIVTGGRNQFANSGIAVPHFDVSGVYPGVPGGMYRFAESSTREEALVARNGDSGRALATLGTAASWFGGSVVIDRSRGQGGGIQYASAGAGGSSGPATVYTVIQIDGKTVIRALTPAAQRRGSRNGGVTGLG